MYNLDYLGHTAIERRDYDNLAYLWDSGTVLCIIASSVGRQSFRFGLFWAEYQGGLRHPAKVIA